LLIVIFPYIFYQITDSNTGDINEGAEPGDDGDDGDDNDDDDIDADEDISLASKKDNNQPSKTKTKTEDVSGRKKPKTGGEICLK
jgi:hypothetical protein